MPGVKVPLETITEPQVALVWAKVPPKDSSPWYQSTDADGVKPQLACRAAIGEAEMYDADVRTAAMRENFAIVEGNVELEEGLESLALIDAVAIEWIDVDTEGDSGRLTYLIAFTTNLIIAMHCLPRIHGYML